MLSREDNERLTRVGPGTPMGTTMRRYWIPALLAWELPEPDWPAGARRLLGEDLVAFRDTQGRDRPARRALPAPPRLALLRPQRGVRPALRLPRLEVRRRRPLRGHDERARGAAASRTRSAPPPTPRVEAGRRDLGLHGPARSGSRAPPHFAWTQAPADASPRVEGDPGEQLAAGPRGRHRHLARAHPAPAPRPPTPRGRASSRRTPSCAARRRRSRSTSPTTATATPGVRPLDEASVHVRAYHFILPFHQIRPVAPAEPAAAPRVAGHIWVPMDDENTMVYNWEYSRPTEPLTDEDRPRAPARQRPARRRPDDLPLDRATGENNYLLDRQVQKTETLHRHRRHQRPGPRGPGEHGRRSSTAAASTSGPPTARSSRRAGCSCRPSGPSRPAAPRRGVAPTYYTLRAGGGGAAARRPTGARSSPRSAPRPQVLQRV